jgi:hypothetical protein
MIYKTLHRKLMFEQQQTLLITYDHGNPDLGLRQAQQCEGVKSIIPSTSNINFNEIFMNRNRQKTSNVCVMLGKC